MKILAFETKLSYLGDGKNAYNVTTSPILLLRFQLAAKRVDKLTAKAYKHHSTSSWFRLFLISLAMDVDDDVELGPGRDIPTDGIPVNFVPAKAGDVIKLGLITCRVLEDGSRTGELPSDDTLS